MAIERYQRTESIEHGKIAPATGLRAVADSWEQVGKVGGQMAQEGYEQAVEEAKLAGQREGDKAVWVDPETNKPTVVGTLPDGTRPYAVAYRKAAEARYQSELGVASMAKSVEMANASNGNPEAFRNNWSGYMKGITESLPEDLRPGADDLLKQLGVRQYNKLQMDDYQRTQGQAKVSALSMADLMERNVVDTLRTTGLSSGSPEFMQEQRGTMEALLGDQVRYGIMTPEESDARIKDYDFRVERGAIVGEAIKMAKAGKAGEVQGFLDEYVRSPNKNVDDYQRNLISDYAKGEVATELSKFKAAEAAALEAAKAQVKDVIKVSSKGEQHAMDDVQALRTAMATGDQTLITELQTSLTKRGALIEFRNASPAEQRAQYQAAATPGQKQTGDTLDLRDDMKAILMETESAIASRDTLELAGRRGIVTPDAVDWANPATLEKRAADLNVVDENFGVRSNPLLPVEKEQFVATMDSADVKGKLEHYAVLKQTMGADNAFRVMHQIGNDRPSMTWAMLTSDEDPATARGILMGDLARAADKQLLGDSDEDLRDQFDTHIGTAFQHDDTMRNAAYEAAKSLYAERKKRGENLTPADFSKVVDRVTGGVAEVNGFKTVVPVRGMDEDGFNRLIDKMTTADFIRAAGGKKLVTSNGEEVPASLIQDSGIFEWVGNGQYLLSIDIGSISNGRAVYLADEKGNILKDKQGPLDALLDMRALAGGQ